MTTRGEDRKGFHPSWMRTLPMTKALASEGSPTQPQPVAIPLTRAAIFLVVTVKPGAGNRGAIRSFCADLAALVRSVGFRELEGSLKLRRLWTSPSLLTRTPHSPRVAM